MRWMILSVVLASVTFAPTPAEAGPLVEVSLGQGYRLSPSPADALGFNFMVAPGYSLLAGVLKLELGIMGNLEDVEQSDFDLNLRPMIVVKPPILPVYGRAIFAIQGLVDSPVTVAYGGALGLSFGIPFTGIGIFGEVGVLPRVVHSVDVWVLEWRLGASYEF
jgi:hypothetical protein